MTLNDPLPQLTKQTIMRLPKIKQGLKDGLSYPQIAEQCNVYEKTIDRDMKAWVQSGDFEIWLKTEFVTLHSHVVVANPIEAYKEISKIVGKMVTQKRELSIDETLTEKTELKIDLSVLSNDDKSILDKAARILDSTSKRRLSDLH